MSSSYWPFSLFTAQTDSASVSAAPSAVSVAASATTPSIEENFQENDGVMISPKDALTPKSKKIIQLESELKKVEAERDAQQIANMEVRDDRDKLRIETVQSRFEMTALQNDISSLKQQLANESMSKAETEQAFFTLLSGAKELEEAIDLQLARIKELEKDSLDYRAQLEDNHKQIIGLKQDLQRKYMQLNGSSEVIQTLEEIIAKKDAEKNNLTSQLKHKDDEKEEISAHFLQKTKELENIIARQNRKINEANLSTAAQIAKRSFPVKQPDKTDLSKKLHDRLHEFKLERRHHPSKMFTPTHQVVLSRQQFQPAPRAKR